MQVSLAPAYIQCTPTIQQCTNPSIYLTCAHICMHTHECIDTHTHPLTYTHTHTHPCAVSYCTHTHTHMYVWTHTQIHVHFLSKTSQMDHRLNHYNDQQKPTLQTTGNTQKSHKLLAFAALTLQVKQCSDVIKCLSNLNCAMRTLTLISISLFVAICTRLRRSGLKAQPSSGNCWSVF